MTTKTTQMDGFRFRKLSAALGAEIMDLDLSQSISPTTVSALRQCWLDHQVLLVRNQQLKPTDQIRFSEYFGVVDDYPLVHFQHPDESKLMVLTNAPSNDKTSTSKNAGARWHTDLSFTPNPATASLLYCRQLPDLGSDTLFANQYLAYQSLSPLLQDWLKTLEAVHELFSGRTDALDERMLEMKKAHAKVAQPMIRLHPETNKLALYINPSITHQIVGLSKEESEGLLKYLGTHCVRHEYIYRHSWQKDDLLMWDNRCLLHLAVQDYEQTRLMHRTTITGQSCGRILDNSYKVNAPSAQKTWIENS
ncbi:MAG: TauD/TfdA dioxygenase family protein [Burkholderiaceae bacterium]